MKIIFFLIPLILLSCVSNHHKADRLPQGVGTYRPESISLYNDLTKSIEESKQWRVNSQEFYQIITTKNKEGMALTFKETEDFFKKAREYLVLRKKLFAITKKYQYLVEKDVQTKIVLNEPSSRSDKGGRLFKLNPKDDFGREALFGLRISLTAALILYDNFLTGIKPHYDNAISRKKLKFDVSKQETGTFDELVKSFFNTDQRVLLSRAMHLFSSDLYFKNQYQLNVPDVENKLNDEIVTSAFYNYMMKEGMVSGAWSDRITRNARGVVDDAKFAVNAALFGVSFVFGNVVGAISSEDRKGDLLKLPEEEKAYIRSKLKPFDILLERTPFKLTDKFIPGYYGHVAVYLGTEEQLKAEGLWNSLKPKMKIQISKGETILEALRYDERASGLDKLKGVQLNSLQSFLNIDELLVIRSRNEFTMAQKITYLENAKEQFGKEYDFNFDVESRSKIVCSELAYAIFTDITWPFQRSVGRFTISPDHVMTQAFPGKPFAPVLMYDKNGIRKEGNEKDKLSIELFRNIQNNYMDMVYKEESIQIRTQEPQEIIHLASGIAALQKRIELIRNAKDSIDLEYFIFKTESDIASRIITQELVKKANQNSQIRPNEKISVRLLVDSSAAVFKLKDPYATMLKENNIHVRYYNQNESLISNFMKANQRNHRKTMIVDGAEAITGGRNIGSEYFDLSPAYNFLDTDIYIKGSIVKTMRDSFDAYWFSPLSSEPKYLVNRSKPGSPDEKYTKSMATAKAMIKETSLDRDYWKTINSWGPLMLGKQFKTECNDSTFVSDLPNDNKDSRRVFQTIKDIVGKATSSLSVESPYFVISERGAQIFGALLNRPGFVLNIQTNSLNSTDATYTTAAFYPIIQEWTNREGNRANIWIYKGDTPDGEKYMKTPQFQKESVWGIHSKRAVVDGHTTMIGTFNVDPRSADLNNEMVFICHNNKLLAENVLEDMDYRKIQSAKLGVDGLPLDKTDIYQDASKRKKVEYFLAKKLVAIPAIRDLL